MKTNVFVLRPNKEYLNVIHDLEFLAEIGDEKWYFDWRMWREFGSLTEYQYGSTKPLRSVFELHSNLKGDEYWSDMEIPALVFAASIELTLRGKPLETNK